MGRLCDLSPQSADALISCWPGVPHLTALSPLCPQCAQALAGSGHARRTTSAATPSVWAAATHRTTPRPAWPAGTTSTRASACPPARLTPTGSRAGAAWTGTPALTSPARRAGTPKASSSMTASACRSAHRASSAMAPRGQWPSSPRASPPSPPPSPLVRAASCSIRRWESESGCCVTSCVKICFKSALPGIRN
jgi:hypothetical protein